MKIGYSQILALLPAFMVLANEIGDAVDASSETRRREVAEAIAAAIRALHAIKPELADVVGADELEEVAMAYYDAVVGTIKIVRKFDAAASMA